MPYEPSSNMDDVCEIATLAMEQPEATYNSPKSPGCVIAQIDSEETEAKGTTVKLDGFPGLENFFEQGKAYTVTNHVDAELNVEPYVHEQQQQQQQPPKEAESSGGVKGDDVSYKNGNAENGDGTDVETLKQEMTKMKETLDKVTQQNKQLRAFRDFYFSGDEQKAVIKSPENPQAKGTRAPAASEEEHANPEIESDDTTTTTTPLSRAAAITRAKFKFPSSSSSTPNTDGSGTRRTVPKRAAATFTTTPATTLDISTATPPSRRGRGRPKKQVTPNSAPAASSKTTRATAAAANARPRTGSATGTGRGPGRPRKHIAGADGKVEKRRGRPHKSI